MKTIWRFYRITAFVTLIALINLIVGIQAFVDHRAMSGLVSLVLFLLLVLFVIPQELETDQAKHDRFLVDHLS